MAALKPSARYIAFYCADTLEQTLDGTGQYYETIDLVDAFHPQTILAYEMNDEPLPVANGAPLRLRVERQLGYKMAKYVMRIEAIESFEQVGAGSRRLLGGSRLRMVRGHLTAWVEIFDACRKTGFSRSRMRPGQRVQVNGLA